MVTATNTKKTVFNVKHWVHYGHDEEKTIFMTVDAPQLFVNHGKINEVAEFQKYFERIVKQK
jgi:hypothetical protein